MTARQIIVVDVETTGLNPLTHVVVEVAWHNLTTDEVGRFVPPHNVHAALESADINALRVNRYIDRLADDVQDYNDAGVAVLADNLQGNTLAGSNPAFDAMFLTAMWNRQYPNVREDNPCNREVPRWHHRLLDLSAFAAGVLDLDPTELPGLAKVAELCGVEHRDPHTAAGDVACTAECFRVLMAHQAEKRAGVA